MKSLAEFKHRLKQVGIDETTRLIAVFSEPMSPELRASYVSQRLNRLSVQQVKDLIRSESTPIPLLVAIADAIGFVVQYAFDTPELTTVLIELTAKKYATRVRLAAIQALINAAWPIVQGPLTRIADDPTEEFALQELAREGLRELEPPETD